MSAQRSRPILAVRLIGPTDIVTAQRTVIITDLVKRFGGKAVCRVSTHPAGYTGEIRVYLTVTPKGEG